MSIIVQVTDYSTGSTKLPMDKYTKPDIQAYIDEWEPVIMQELLGCELYADFLIDWALPTAGEPTAAKFKEIYDPFCIDEQPCGVIQSQGIKTMLTKLIYFYYLRDLPVKKTIGGINHNIQANADQSLFSESNLYSVYNEGVKSYQVIQWIICDNPNSYDWAKFNGTTRAYISKV